MECSQCHSSLDRPGDRCLRCDTRNADGVVVELLTETATITMFDGTDELGRTTITTKPELADPLQEIHERNYVGRIADELRRKDVPTVCVTGDRDLIHRLRRHVTVELRRLDGDDPVAAYRDRVEGEPLEVIERQPAEKLGGSHTTVVGGRQGRRVLELLGEHPHVKKIIPGPIDAGGSGSRVGLHGVATRATTDGNVRVLIRDGSSVQTVRLVTTAADRPDGDRIVSDLNEALTTADLGRSS